MMIYELLIYKFGGWGLLFNTPTRVATEFPLIMQSLLRRALRARAVSNAKSSITCDDPGWAYRREAPSRQTLKLYLVHCKS